MGALSLISAIVTLKVQMASSGGVPLSVALTVT